MNGKVGPKGREEKQTEKTHGKKTNWKKRLILSGHTKLIQELIQL